MSAAAGADLATCAAPLRACLPLFPSFLHLQLTLTYNRTRQASITTELIEIISGATALAG